MLGTAKPLASLSSKLLTRKGQARPAMRRHMTLAQAGDDLGWNDMGEPDPETPAAPLPPVLVEREALAEEIEAQAEAPEETKVPAPVEAVVAPVVPIASETAPEAVAVIRREAAARGKAAFTLRLDAERHLRLRLASATRGRSSQQLVTQALDALLATMPDVETLARHLPPAKR